MRWLGCSPRAWEVFRTGKRWFQFFAARELREMMLAYALPEHMPNALPFALNGSGTFYLFDTRALPSAGEYPVVCSAAGNTGWGTDECALIAERFLDACMGTRCVDEILRELT